MDERLAAAIEGAWREVAAVDAAYERGQLDDDGWHRAMAAIIVPKYLAAADVRAGSGHTGSGDDWEWSRGLVADGLNRDGTFLDVGCANGLLMESVARWGRAAGLAIEPYGLDIAPELAEVARTRLPRWADRIFVANALGWTPPQRFDYVRTAIDYVPPRRRPELVAWLLDHVVAPGGRLLLGKHNEVREQRSLEQQLGDWGFAVAGRAERAHRSEPRIAYRVLWLDPPAHVSELGFRPLEHADLPRMERWRSAPHVDAWWVGPRDLAGLRSKYGPRIDGREPVHVFVIEQGGAPIGWIQWYRWSDYAEHAELLEAGPNSASVDLAIGERSAIGRGLGALVLRAFLQREVFAQPDVVACVSDVEVSNLRSVRAFLKAGFQITRSLQLPGEPGQRHVMRIERA